LVLGSVGVVLVIAVRCIRIHYIQLC
jgi:hypothetical protein